MKTKIRKFLWFDITPRKELYAEIGSCYETIKQQNKELYDTENQLNETRSEREQLLNDKLDLERQIWDHEEHIHQLQERIDDLLGICELEDEPSL